MSAVTPNPENFAIYSRPQLVELLQAVQLDIIYEQGEGNTLTYRNERGEVIKVLDLLGGFGVSLFGHNHARLVATACEVFQQKRPFVAQGSVRGYAGQLAKRLSDMVRASTGKTYVVTLANSGTEAVEAALKHAAWEKGKMADAILAANDRTFRAIRTQLRDCQINLNPELFCIAEQLLGVSTIRNLADLQYHLRQYNEHVLYQGHVYLAIQGAFHGKTTGAVQLTYNPDFRQPWQHLGIQSLFTPLNDGEALAHCLASQRTSYLALTLSEQGGVELEKRPWSTIVACLAEPILGEGGIHPLTDEFLRSLRTGADSEGFPLILDEIQSGMGRTGTFLASEHSGVAGDYYLFSKALGGGLAKISALLVDQKRYIKQFGSVHTSTFGDDDFSSAIALSALDLLENEGLMDRCAQMGRYLLEKMGALQKQYPTLIKEVRGRGLLLGIEFSNLPDTFSRLLKIAADQHLLGFLFSGYLLHEHQIRVTPTISATNTLRIEPSALITKEECDRFCNALANGVRLLAESKTREFTRFLTGVEMNESFNVPSAPKETAVISTRPKKITRKVACLIHFLEPEDLLAFDPTLNPLTQEQCSRLLAQTQLVIEPFVIGEQQIESVQNESVNLVVIGIPYTSAQIAERQRSNQLAPVLTAIEQGIDIAKGLGCTVIGMTGYTSIVTQNCTHFVEDEIALTSGNSLTAAAAVSAIQQLTVLKKMDTHNALLGIVGGVGNIGAVMSEVMLDTFSQIRLFGRPASTRRLDRLKQKLHGQRPDASIGISTDMVALADCQVIISATNAPNPIIGPEHLGEHETVLCDLAVPADVAPHLSLGRPQACVVQGGRFQLPLEQSWQIPGLDSGNGEAYACVVETLLLGLAGVRHHFSYGALEASKVRHIQRLAETYGFSLSIHDESWIDNGKENS